MRNNKHKINQDLNTVGAGEKMKSFMTLIVAVLVMATSNVFSQSTTDSTTTDSTKVETFIVDSMKVGGATITQIHGALDSASMNLCLLKTKVFAYGMTGELQYEFATQFWAAGQVRIPFTMLQGSCELSIGRTLTAAGQLLPPPYKLNGGSYFAPYNKYQLVANGVCLSYSKAGFNAWLAKTGYWSFSASYKGILEVIWQDKFARSIGINTPAVKPPLGFMVSAFAGYTNYSIDLKDQATFVVNFDRGGVRVFYGINLGDVQNVVLGGRWDVNKVIRLKYVYNLKKDDSFMGVVTKFNPDI